MPHEPARPSIGQRRGLLDPNRARPGAAALLIVGGRIADVGPERRRSALAPGGAEVIDCRGLSSRRAWSTCACSSASPARSTRSGSRAARRPRPPAASPRMVVLPEHRPADRRPCDGRVRGPPRAPGEARQDLSLRRDHQGAGGQGAGRDRPAQAAGAVAFTDGDQALANAQVMRRALSYARLSTR